MMGYSKSFDTLLAPLKNKVINRELVNTVAYLVNSSTCCGVKELTHLVLMNKNCTRLNLNFKEQLALFLRDYNKKGYTLLYYNITSDKENQFWDGSVEDILNILREFGFTEFTRFINANYKYRADYSSPIFTIGLQLIPEFEQPDNEDNQ